MRVRAVAVAVLLTGLSLVAGNLGQAQAAPQAAPLIRSVEMDMTINPASAEWVKQALDEAKQRQRLHGDLPPGHARRARRLDAQDHQADHRRADAGGRVRLSERRARRLRRPLHHGSGGRRGDGAADEHRLGNTDLAGRRKPGQGAGPQDPKRRGRVRARARRRSRPQRGPGRADGPEGDQRARRRSASAATSST